MLWQGVVHTLLPLAGGTLMLFFLQWRSTEEPPSHWMNPIGREGCLMAVAFSVLLWIAPYGALLALPILFCLSVISPAARIEWKTHAKNRFAAITLALMFFSGGAMLPVSDPVSPDRWGQPTFVENPNAPLYPSSEQFTWLMPSLEIVQSLSIRMPHQTGTVGAESSTFSLAFGLGVESSRMQQAIELLEEQLPFGQLNSEEIILLPILAHDTHRYAGGDIDTTLQVRLFEIRSTAIGSSADGTKIGEVICMGEASWGGQLDLLVIVRPLGHRALDNDRFAETLTLEWIGAMQSQVRG